jgi:hypothetical protein
MFQKAAKRLAASQQQTKCDAPGRNSFVCTVTKICDVGHACFGFSVKNFLTGKEK